MPKTDLGCLGQELRDGLEQYENFVGTEDQTTARNMTEKEDLQSEVHLISAKLFKATMGKMFKTCDRLAGIQEGIIGVLENATERIQKLEERLEKEAPATAHDQAEAPSVDQN